MPDHIFEFNFPSGPPRIFVVHLPDVVTEALIAAMDEHLAPVLAAVQSLSTSTRTMGEHMALDLTALQDAVAGVATVNDSAILLIESIAAQLAEMAQNNVDPAALQALADSLLAESASLGQAVVAGTPVVP